MKKLSPIKQARVLIIDDNTEIHQDIHRVLAAPEQGDDGLNNLEADIFDSKEDKVVARAGTELEIDSAYQGQEGYEMVKKARNEGRPYAMAFVDMRMPPGWDGLETVQHLWKVDPKLEVVICTAFSDNPWDEVISTIGHNDKLLILKKPFEMIEVQQMARALTTKWILSREVEERLTSLEVLVSIRTQDLEDTGELLQKEIQQRKRVERELRHAQKFETVGQLAAGVVHEINTPIQFVGDSVRFLKGAFESLEHLIVEYKKSYQFLSEQNCAEMIKQLKEKEKEFDLSYLKEEVPRALGDTIEGISRVAAMVSALEKFAHSDSVMASVDINKAIENTVTVIGGEYRPAVEIKLDLAKQLPEVACQLGDINQALYNLIINAARSIVEGHTAGNGGRIEIKTSQSDASHVMISIHDNGVGIPEKMRARIFDPFFAASEVGYGNRQGLAIAHSIIVEKHQGKIHFETAQNQGTTFFVELPVFTAVEQDKKAG